MASLLSKILGKFINIRDVLAENGWVVTDEHSPRWWGGLETPDEVFISAILVQQTRWRIVENVINRLRELGLNKLEKLANMDPGELAQVIKGVNFRYVKARRLIEASRAVASIGGLGELARRSDYREFLMGIRGIGPETADSIALYALNKYTIPVSAYTRRVLGRVLGLDEELGYEDYRAMLLGNIPRGLFNLKLFHAGMVTVGKVWCGSRNTKCGECPLRDLCNRFKGVGGP